MRAYTKVAAIYLVTAAVATWLLFSLGFVEWVEIPGFESARPDAPQPTEVAGVPARERLGERLGEQQQPKASRPRPSEATALEPQRAPPPVREAVAPPREPLTLPPVTRPPPEPIAAPAPPPRSAVASPASDVTPAPTPGASAAAPALPTRIAERIEKPRTEPDRVAAAPVTSPSPPAAVRGEAPPTSTPAAPSTMAPSASMPTPMTPPATTASVPLRPTAAASGTRRTPEPPPPPEAAPTSPPVARPIARPVDRPVPQPIAPPQRSAEPQARRPVTATPPAPQVRPTPPSAPRTAEADTRQPRVAAPAPPTPSLPPSRRWTPTLRLAGFGADDLVDRLDDARQTPDDIPCIAFDKIRFRPGTAAWSRGQQPRDVDLIADVLKAYPDARVEIGSRIGTDRMTPANRRLAIGRARVVRNALLARGVTPGRVGIDQEAAFHVLLEEVGRLDPARAPAIGVCVLAVR